MQLTLYGKPSFGYAEIKLEPGEKIITESGAMATMSSSIDLKAKLNGGFFKGLIRKYFGNESLFVNEFSNKGSQTATMTITQPTPGDLILKEMQNEDIFLQPSAFVACEEGLKISLKFAGFTSFIAREGLFKIKVSGTGKLLFGAYGNIMERNVNGEMIVDTGHLVAYEPQIKLKLQMAGGIISSFTSGEGLVTRVEGNGKIWIQSRSLSGLASWLNKFFR
jgi:uncharacterized protein (TIGR00266 family)